MSGGSPGDPAAVLEVEIGPESVQYDGPGTFFIEVATRRSMATPYDLEIRGVPNH